MDLSEMGLSGLKPSVEFAFLADAVQVVGGKLFALEVGGISCWLAVYQPGTHRWV